MPPTRCLFASDLHGHVDRWEKLLAETEARRPDAVLVGGDLLPGGASLAGPPDFLRSWLGPRLEALRERMASSYPQIFAIFGNDDPRSFEPSLGALEAAGLLRHAHGRRLPLGAHSVYGYACVPPTPFALKDWERYDVSRYVDPGCVSPEEGRRSVAVREGEARWGTIADDLASLAGDDDLRRSVWLFHAPPHRVLDRADLDGREIDHVPVDPHVGSIAIRRFLEARQPLVSLHGHVHESARLTGAWQARLGRTVCLSAAHDGPELALVRFDLEDPGAAVRELL
jgi:Icc-related predicted phosphoesterase